jgi:Domain of unknown function (DUF4111)/beta-1,4-mannooligosaccharide phosphorylase
MLLDPEDVTRVLARSTEPLLEPELPGEREGVVANVVFPTAIDRRSEDEADVYYGMADARIGAFRLTMGPVPVDFHVATAGTLGEPALDRLRALHAGFKAEGGWVSRLEGAYLTRSALRRHDPDGGRCPTVGSDWDFTLGRPGPTWVLDRWVTREHGVVVTGPDPRALIDPIGPGELRAAVLASMLDDWAERLGPEADLGWLRPRNYQAFSVLTMCRDLYVLERGTLVSKTAAATWAARRLGPPWEALVERALAWRGDERPDDRQLPETMRFVAHAVELARSVE